MCLRFGESKVGYKFSNTYWRANRNYMFTFKKKGKKYQPVRKYKLVSDLERALQYGKGSMLRDASAAGGTPES